MQYILIGVCFLSLVYTSCAQLDNQNGQFTFTKADTLRGMLRPERTCFDVTFYKLNIEVKPTTKTIQGFNEIHYTIQEDFKWLQIDLFENLKITKIEHQQRGLDFKRMHNAVFVKFPERQTKGKKDKIRVYYEGKPIVAVHPPWDGGFVWAKEEQNKDWIGVACQGVGASLWWPNKDHLSDEPDSMLIQITVPDNLTCVANGNLRQVKTIEKDKKRFDWFVSYPINNYSVSINIADYAHFRDVYVAQDGDSLDLDFYVLKRNEAKAKKHFQEVHMTLESFEHYFGKYPFWRDGYALVETPYLGMEHQSGIAYGNKYMRGYLGGLVPRGIDFDYIIVHETGHEYFGNSISCKDQAELWIHESFTTYMESLFVEYKYDYKTALRYIQSQRGFIGNREPIIGLMNVNFDRWSKQDHYYKGAWVLHTLRHVIGNDDLWKKILKSFHDKKRYSNVVTQDFVNHVNEQTNQDFTAFFKQYLNHAAIPRLEYKIKKRRKKIEVQYRWAGVVEDFDMPILVGKKIDYQRITPKSTWQKIKLKGLAPDDFKVATELFLVNAVLVR